MKKILFASGALCMLLLTACNKELSDNFTIYTAHPLNDTVWVRNVSATASIHTIPSLLAQNVIVDSFETSRDTTLNYGDSLAVSFTAGSCVNAGGTPVLAGKLRLEILWVRSRGDFIKAFVPTTSYNNILESAGAFFIRISKDGKELALASNAAVNIRFSDTRNPVTSMQVHYGRESSPVSVNGIDTAFTWIRNSDSAYIKLFQKSAQGAGTSISGYDMLVKSLRWVAAERPIDSSKPRVKLTAVLPLNFTNRNTVAFAVFNDIKTVVQLKADFNSRAFAAVNIPAGTRLKIVTISRIGDDLYLGVRDVSDVGTPVYYAVTPEKKSLKDVIGFLNNL